MPITDYYQWDWRKRHLITSSQRQTVLDYFAPYDKRTGQMYDTETLVNIIAEFSEFYFGDAENEAHYHISSKVPEFHKNIYRDLAVNHRYYYITCPSEFGKTTIATLVYPIYRALYKLDPFITIGGSTQQLSEEEHFDNVKRELEQNEKLIEFFGEQKPRSITRLTRNKPWSAAEIELPTGVVMRALGCMGKIRGRKSGAIRPTLVIIDDPEEAEDVDSEALLSRHRKWLFRNVMYRIDGTYGKIRLIGNMLSDNCLLAMVKRDKAWKGVDYAALDDNDRSIWEERWPTSFLLKERQNAIDSGRYEEWMYERMNRPVVTANRRIEYILADLRFERRNDQNLLYVNDFDPIVVTTWLGIDPEIAADDWGPRAFITMARGFFPMKDNPEMYLPCIFALDYLNRPLDPSDIIDAVADAHQKYYYSGVAIESNTWQVIFQNDFAAYIATDEFYNKHPFRFTPIVAQRAKKVTRILRFQNPGKRGMLYINRGMDALCADFDFVSIGKEKGLHLADAFEMAYRHSEPPREGVRSYAGEDTHRDLRYHTPWKDAIKPQSGADRIERHDNWKSIHLPRI